MFKKTHCDLRFVFSYRTPTGVCVSQVYTRIPPGKGPEKETHKTVEFSGPGPNHHHHHPRFTLPIARVAKVFSFHT